jgi:surfactin synthase thioesterase subunit
MNANGSAYIKLAEGRIGLRQFRDVGPSGPALFCFPYAGGQSLAFRGLADCIPPEWSIWAVDPPGHGWVAGPPWDSVEAMAEGYLKHVPRHLLSRSVLLGHSLGGCVAFAIARQLQQEASPPPALVLSGTRPPGRLAEYESFLAMDDPTLLKCLIQIGGVPPDWADEPELFEMFKEPLRADFRAFESFRIEEKLVGVPCLSLGGLSDDVCRSHHVFDWSRHCADCRVDFVQGGHLFIQSNPQAVAQRILGFAQSLNLLSTSRS